jgi:hypothetical protein
MFRFSASALAPIDAYGGMRLTKPEVSKVWKAVAWETSDLEQIYLSQEEIAEALNRQGYVLSPAWLSASPSTVR